MRRLSWRGTSLGGCIHTPATHYDPDKILNRESFFFEQAKPESFTVMDCFVHATNGGFRCPIFVDRKQVFQLSLETSKRRTRISSQAEDEVEGLPTLFVRRLRREGLQKLLDQDDCRSQGDYPIWAR
jgi:hypothetical protein